MSMKMKFLALAAATLLFVGGWYFLGFKPATSKLKEVKAQVDTTRAEVAALEVRLARLQELKRNEKDLRAQAARFDKGLPTTPSVPKFIRQVQGIASEAGIDFLSVAPTVPTAAAAPAPPPPPADGSAAAAPPAVAGPALSTIGVSLNATGGFFDIESFVAKMEDLERALRIDTFSLGGSGDKLTLAISMKMFMAAPPPAPAPAAPAASPPPVEGT